MSVEADCSTAPWQRLSEAQGQKCERYPIGHFLTSSAASSGADSLISEMLSPLYKWFTIPLRKPSIKICSPFKDLPVYRIEAMFCAQFYHWRKFSTHQMVRKTLPVWSIILLMIAPKSPMLSASQTGSLKWHQPPKAKGTQALFNHSQIMWSHLQNNMSIKTIINMTAIS